MSSKHLIYPMNILTLDKEKQQILPTEKLEFRSVRIS